ncbi:MAG: Hpt domain-containing protein [Bacteroidetes bacterium]|nr:Hpt domain-containing protein [Bacteroidota bacterium]
MANYKHIDLNYLNDLSLGSKDFMEDIINSFLKTTPGSIEKMKECLVKQDWQQIGGIAHKLKTSYSFMGMSDMVEVSKELQECGLKVKELEKIPALLDQMTTAYGLAEVELKEELSQLQS